MKKIRVVVVDDSAFSRRTIIRMLEELPEVEVVGYASDGEDGIRKVIDLKPDLVTLDLEMPRMDGFTLLRIIMGCCATPVIIISSRSDDERVFKGLELGAVDFIAKPGNGITADLLSITRDLHAKVRNVFQLNMAGVMRREQAPPKASSAEGKKKPAPPVAKSLQGRIELVAIGASTGGPPALQQILSSFTKPPGFALAISQHMPAGFTRAFAERLNRLSVIEVREATDGDLLSPGTALIAPGGFNLVVKREAKQAFVRVVKSTDDDKYVPSVDVMFNSCSEVFGSRMLAVVLTGMGNDGTQGCKAVKSAGGQILAEAEDTSVVFGMPKEAIAAGVVDKVVPLDRMAREIMLRCGMVA